MNAYRAVLKLHFCFLRFTYILIREEKGRRYIWLSACSHLNSRGLENAFQHHVYTRQFRNSFVQPENIYPRSSPSVHFSSSFHLFAERKARAHGAAILESFKLFQVSSVEAQLIYRAHYCRGDGESEGESVGAATPRGMFYKTALIAGIKYAPRPSSVVPLPPALVASSSSSLVGPGYSLPPERGLYIYALGGVFLACYTPCNMRARKICVIYRGWALRTPRES